MPVYTWSQTANSNSNADSTINYAEGQAPSTLNDSGRALMAAFAKWNGDISGTITTAGTSTAYTLNSNSLFDTLAHLHNQIIAIVPHTTNTTSSAGSQVTLNVDGLGAKPMRIAPSQELPDGSLVQGTPYIFTYNNTDGAFYLQNFGTNPYQIPLGAMLPYTGSSAPNTSFALPFGQAISRTTFSGLFNIYNGMSPALPYGTGNGSTTFNIVDMRGRVCFGQDNMGGGSAGRITTAGGNWNGTTIGANGGREILAQSALPNATLSVTNNVSGGTIQSNSGGTAPPAVVSQLATAFGSSSLANSYTFTTASMNGGVTQTGALPPGITIPYILRVL
jgi:hypothetical protein